MFLEIVFPRYQWATAVDIEASYKSVPAISYSKYDQAYTSTQKHDWKLWAICRRRISYIRGRDRDSRETYWKSTRHAACPGRYRNCNRRESGGRDSTKHTGTNPMTPVNRKTWNDRRVKQPYWKIMATISDKTVTPRSRKWSSRIRRWRKFIRGQPKGWPNGFHERVSRSDETAIVQLLKKSVRRHPHQKNKPELHMEQGKCKETIRKEAEMLPPRNVSRESDNERNSRVLLETMDTDRCIQMLVRTEPECKVFTLLLKFSQFTNRTWIRYINQWCSEWQVWGL